MYDEEDMLMLSGIQHYMFCPRQWGLIHMEQLWDDNRLTVEGTLLHKRVDDPFYREKNGDTITLRRVALASKQLGLYGYSDAIELHAATDRENSITYDKYPGLWTPYPVEYKHGHHKTEPCDEVQLAAQVMCLEEMYNISLDRAALFYWQTEEREEVVINESLRQLVVSISQAMHEMIQKRTLPPAEPANHCRSCSLKDICLPDISQKNAKTYLKQNLYEEDA